MRSVETYSCKFSDDSNVTVSFDMEAMKVAKNPTTILKFEWDGKPNRKAIVEYVTWMHTVMSQIAKRISKSILYVYPTGNGSECVMYSYEKDGTFKKCNGT